MYIIIINYMCINIAIQMWTVTWAYGKAGNTNEMETGNGNGNKKRTNHWCNVFFIVCLVITLVGLALSGAEIWGGAEGA